MPTEATQHTDTGALAFAKFFIQTLDWGYATSSTSYARHYVSSSCSTCLSFLKLIDDEAAANHHYVGGRVTVTAAAIVPVAGLHNGAQTAVLVTTDVSGSEIVDAADNYVNSAAPVSNYQRQVWVNWGNAWTTADFGPPDQ